MASLMSRNWRLLRDHPLKALALALVMLAAAAGGHRYWIYLHSYVSTEDAQIEGNISPVSSRIDGTIARVYVHNTEFVKAGAPLVDIDPRDYRLAVSSAQANLDEAQAQAQSAGAQHAEAMARLAEDQANAAKARGDAQRFTTMFRLHVVSRENYEEKLRAAKVAAAAVNADRAAATSASKMAAVRTAGVSAARAALDRALLNESYTRIRAPVSGVVGNRTAEVGQRVQPGQGLLSIASLGDLWVTANFKETAIGMIRPGERASIYIDALGRALPGYVEGLGGASGALYSLLPPENASGNWIKVVQRLPVRIRFDKGLPDPPQLRPGLSVEVKVWLSRRG